jgi:hypothetical protein
MVAAIAGRATRARAARPKVETVRTKGDMQTVSPKVAVVTT